MKVKNIVFSGVMGAILMGATGANAAINVASQGYVDSKVGAVSTAVTELETTVSNTYQTKADATTAAADVQTALEGKADKATTLAGYGITDAYTKTETDGLVGAKVSQTDYDAHLTAQAAIDAKQTEDISKNTAALAILNGDAETTGSVKNEIKVLSDLLGGTAGDVSGLTTQVSANTTAIEKLNAEAATIGSVANSIAEALKDYSTTEQVDAKDAATLQSANQYTDTKLGDYTKTSELDAGFVTEDEMTTFKSANTEAIADAKKAGTDAAAAAANAQTQADKGVADAAAAKSAADAAQAQADKGVADAATAKSAADAAKAQADKGVEDAAAAKSAADAAQADADANTESISQLQTDLATKITAPAACEKQDCVLSINKASGTISWVPLTEPVADYL